MTARVGIHQLQRLAWRKRATGGPAPAWREEPAISRRTPVELLLPRLPVPAISRHAFFPGLGRRRQAPRWRRRRARGHVAASVSYARGPLTEGKGWKMAGEAAVGVGEAGVLQLLPTESALESMISGNYSREAVFWRRLVEIPQKQFPKLLLKLYQTNALHSSTISLSRRPHCCLG
jgi:hypothetical protein